jgi:hypothetical protein
MELQKIASVAAPACTPLGPAAILIQGLHDGLVKSGMNTSVAWLPAILSGAGMELTGFLASKMTVRAIKNQDWASMCVAACGIVGYVVFAVIGIQNVPNSEMFQAFVGMSTIAYFAYGVYEWMTTKDEKALKTQAAVLDLNKQKQAADLEYAERMAKIEHERLEREHRLKLDDIRLAKASIGQVQAVQSVQRTTVQNSLNPEWLQKTRDFLRTNPGATTREIAALLGAGSPSTGKVYRDAVLNNP